MLELQAHGGPVRAAAAAGALPAKRAAASACAWPSRASSRERAFLNDKLDLAQAEAVADLIDASTEAAARSAGALAGGRVLARGRRAGASALVQLRMLVEATLDFPEEEIDFLEKADARGQLRRASPTQLDAVLDRARQGALLREGLHVVLAGQPNVGKSSLLNALAGAELAIVTPIPGTTRDKVSETIQIEGVPLHVIDTAGLRDDERPTRSSASASRAAGRRSATPTPCCFLHDLTRAAASPTTKPATRAIAARLPARRAACCTSSTRPTLAAPPRDRCRTRPGAVGAHRRRPRRAAPARC